MTTEAHKKRDGKEQKGHKGKEKAEPGPPPQLTISRPTVPLNQGEVGSLRFALDAAAESVRQLQDKVNQGGQPVMLSWPDLMAEYNFVLTQIHNLTRAVTPSLRVHSLHPTIPIDPGAQEDLQDVIRTIQVEDVVAEERQNMSVYQELDQGVPIGEKYQAIIDDMRKIKREHDTRVGRTLQAIQTLRGRFQFKMRWNPEFEEREALGDGIMDEDEDAALFGSYEPSMADAPTVPDLSMAEPGPDDSDSLSSDSEEIFGGPIVEPAGQANGVGHFAQDTSGEQSSDEASEDASMDSSTPLINVPGGSTSSTPAHALPNTALPTQPQLPPPPHPPGAAYVAFGNPISIILDDEDEPEMALVDEQ